MTTALNRRLADDVRCCNRALKVSSACVPMIELGRIYRNFSQLEPLTG